MSTASDPIDTAPGTLRPHPPLADYYASESERRRRLVGWFDESAPDYDWVTQAMSLGAGSWYRRRTLERARLAPGMEVLDVASGTGVLAALARQIVSPGGRVVALDPSVGMLRRAAARGVRQRVLGVAEALPFPDAAFDRLSMGFALRHVADLRTTFREYRRVLRPGGRLVVLEITPPPRGFRLSLLRLYLRVLVPGLARFGRGGRTSQLLMRYYWDTIESCVPPPVILAALAEAGFTDVGRRVEIGIFSEYTAAA